MDPNAELGNFLRSRRARLRPEGGVALGGCRGARPAAVPNLRSGYGRRPTACWRSSTTSHRLSSSTTGATSWRPTSWLVADIDGAADVVALTIAEFLPRQVMHLRQILSGFPLLSATPAD
ncbi:hypothetical protein [Nonomuraea sp. NPDC049625]|uniref:hypothetical protein n=1 Tax=Nonomuraea sp. NPDC049625 TaxID=3155775 RepID=UPI00342C5C55